MKEITKYLVRMIVVGSVIVGQTSFNRDMNGLELRSYDNKEISNQNEKPIYSQIEEDGSIDLNMLFNDSIKTLSKLDQEFSKPYDSLISKIYNENKDDGSVIDEDFIKANFHEESYFNPKAKSRYFDSKRKIWTGARGIAQLTKDTWYDYSNLKFEKYAFIPETNLDVGIKHLFFIEDYLKTNLNSWDSLPKEKKLIALSEAYNGGQNLIVKAGIENMPEESLKHGKKVMDRYLQYEKTRMNQKYSEYVKGYLKKNNPSWDSLPEKEKYKDINKFYSEHLFKINLDKQFFAGINPKLLKNY